MRRFPFQFMTFPNLTRTKTEALQLAAELFPGERVALRANPDRRSNAHPFQTRELSFKLHLMLPQF